MKNFTAILLLTCSLIISSSLFAQSNVGCFTLGESNKEYGYVMVVTHDGNYVVGGTTETSVTYPDVYLVKSEPSGNVLWSKKLGGSFNDLLNDVIETSDHGLVAVARASTGNIMAIKLDENGNLLWSKDIDLLTGEVVYAVIESEDNGVVMTGYSTPFGAGDKAFLIKLDADGNKEWETVFKNQDNPFAQEASGYSLVRTAENRYVVGGYSPAVPDYYWLASFDASGNFLWAKQSVGGPVYDVVATADSGVIMAGSFFSYETNSADALIAKFDRDGNTEWTKAIGDSLYDVFYGLELTADGGIIAAGLAKNFEVAPDYRSYGYIAKFQPDGDVEWSHILGDATHYRDFQDVHQTDDGGFVAAGSALTNPPDLFVAKFDAQGNICPQCLSGDYGIEVTGPEFVAVTMLPQNDTAAVTDLALNESSGASSTEICIETGIENSNKNALLSVFPNPVSENFQITIPSDFHAEKILIADVNGKIIYNKTVSSGTQLMFDAFSFPNGIYSVQLIAEKKIALAKFSVIH